MKKKMNIYHCSPSRASTSSSTTAATTAAAGAAAPPAAAMIYTLYTINIIT
jgi:hypothetical protein